jgi:protein TonB
MTDNQSKFLTGILSAALLLGAPMLRAQEAKKVSRADAMSAVTTKVAPDYPPMGKQLHIEGTVEVGVVIDETGNVEKADAVSGNPVLTKPAVTALKKWKFKPFQADGKPIKAEATLAIVFKL